MNGQHADFVITTERIEKSYDALQTVDKTLGYVSYLVVCVYVAVQSDFVPVSDLQQQQAVSSTKAEQDVPTG